MLIIVLVVTVTLLYCLGIIVGSSIEKQRWENKKMESRPVQQKPAIPSAMLSERHTYAEHQRILNDQGEVVWEQKTLSKIPNGERVDLLA